MQNYDFLNLSAIEFEDLSRDLLQKHLNIYLESFTEGKDGGIDLRGSINNRKTLLVQCKRYKDYNSLKSNLGKEVLKVKKLNPKRYIITTSVGLTPSNKAELKEMFEPHIVSFEDIFGKDDLNNLLAENKSVEERYHKLWLSSTTVLNAILHANIKNRSEFLVESIKNSIKLFVQNNSFSEAAKILNENNFVIISGNPGVGKTTLAKMLIFQYMAKEFDLIEITEDIEEGNKLFSHNKNQVFYYDDFLGSNFLEKSIAKNEDKRLYNFMERIRTHNNKKLIMTTREYILKQAQQKYEILGRSDIDIAKHILDLENYTRVAKAEIFYNHLFFSELSEDYLKAVVSNKGYYKIINHPNYNPRVIELMTIRLNKKLIPPGKYLTHFLSSLTNPSEIWKMAFENQISELSKYILYALLITSSSISVNRLILSVKSMVDYDSVRFSLSLKRGDFLQSLKELDNTFIKITKGSDNEDYIQFQNPSVRDFLLHYLETDHDLIEMIVKSMVFFNQLFTIFNLYERKSSENEIFHKIFLKGKLSEVIEEKIINDFDKMLFIEYDQAVTVNEKLIYLNRFYSYHNEKINVLLAKKIEEIDISLFEEGERETLTSIISILQDYLNLNLPDFLMNYTNHMTSLSDVRGLIELADIYPEEYKIFFDENSNHLTETIAKAIKTDVDNVDDSEDEVQGLIDELEEVGDFFDVKLSRVLSDLREKLEDINKDSDDDSDHRLISKKEDLLDKSSEDSKIDSMFVSLLR